MAMPMALSGVPTDDVKLLLRFVHRSEISVPITPGELARCGLQHRSEEFMQSLRGLDELGVRAVLIAVAAERMAASERSR